MSAGAAAVTNVRNERLRLLARNARSFGARFLSRRDGAVGLIVLVVFAVLALFPDFFVGPLETATRATGHALEPPSGAHIFGTDDLGRDMFNRTVHGARISMTIGLLATLITVVVGTLVGIVSGYVGGRIDGLLMRISDFFLVLPTFVLAIILAPVIIEVVGVESEVFGIRATLMVIIIVIGLTSWATTARIIRSQVLSLKGRMFVDRARVIGAGPGRIMVNHILPNVMNLIVAQAVLTFAVAVFTETTLSFIGLGDPFQPSWGEILNAAESTGAPGLGAWWYIAPPAASVVLVVLAFTLVGNALDDLLNPKSAGRR
ncbi:MAG TPA: ABC transporter permease [Candidatus Limnocylindrales bacterium]|nr:ABC transporter permease [Candidatus Limnocylindrales bacterium]